MVAEVLWGGDFGPAGNSKTVAALLGGDTSALHLVVRGRHPGYFSVATAVSPKGKILGKGQCKPLCVDCPNRLQAAPGTGAALFPNAGSVSVTGGSWGLSACGYVQVQEGNSFSYAPYLAGPSQLVLFARKGPVPTAGRLRVRLWLGAKLGLTPASAASDPRLSKVVASAQAILASAGVALEVEGWRALPASAPDPVLLPAALTVSGASDLDALVSAAALPAEATESAFVDVFLVSRVVRAGAGGQGSPVEGGSGGIPGPAFFHGVPGAGVVVGLDGLPTEGEGEDAKPDDGSRGGRALARQLGHFLGLFETSGSGGEGHDPIADTPECTAAADSDKDGALSNAECAGKGGGNAMFWRSDSAAASFSAEQAQVLRGHPLVLPKP